MQVIKVHETGGPEKLVYESAALPQPGAGEVRVKVAAVGVNFLETYLRRGWNPSPLPFIPGSEFAGVVDALGPGVNSLEVGDRVATAGGVNAYAEYTVAPANSLVRVPDGVSLEQAAGLLLQGMTAHYLALSVFPLREGHTALIHAGAGGAGQMLLQVAKMQGARTISTVSTPQKAEIARECGADEVILYSEQDFEAETKRLTGGKGVDVVYDAVGKTTFIKSLNCLRPRGMMVLYGQSSGVVDPIDPRALLSRGSLFLTRPTLVHYTLTREELEWRAGDVLRWLAEGKLKLRIDKSFALKDAAESHRYLEARSTLGKVLLIP